MPSSILFTVTNHLNHDQRMHRIASSLLTEGYQVLLVGVQKRQSPPLIQQAFQQKRLYCYFEKGPGFYIEYNIRLFLFLLFAPYQIVCAIDLDTILPVLFATSIKGTKRVYDAHEYFTEMKEVRTRPIIQRIWRSIEQFAVPRFKNGYTVNSYLSNLFKENYGVQYKIIRNIPVKYPLQNIDNQLNNKIILYQGAVNEGRCFEQLIPAMQTVDAVLWIVGEGNFLKQTIALIKECQLENKVILKGTINPSDLRLLTQQATIGITLFEQEGINQYYSLANRFFDYMMAGIPQLCVNYPLYAAIVEEYPFALLIPTTDTRSISEALNKLLQDDVLYTSLRLQCNLARNYLNWEHESQKLIEFYQQL